MDPAPSLAAELWRPHHHRHHFEASSVVTDQGSGSRGGGGSGRRRPRSDAGPEDDDLSKVVSTSAASGGGGGGGQDSVRPWGNRIGRDLCWGWGLQSKGGSCGIVVFDGPVRRDLLVHVDAHALLLL